MPGINFVVVQHLIRGLYHKLEKRQQPIVRLSGRSTYLVSSIVSLDFLVVSGFGAVLHLVIVVVLKLLLVDRCPTRMSSIFGQRGSLGNFGWVMLVFYSYYAPRISPPPPPPQVDAVGCKVSVPTVRMSIDSTVFLCVCPLRQRQVRDGERERERERESLRARERKEEEERDRERERGGEGRERKRKREGENEKEREKRGEKEDSSRELTILSRQVAFHDFFAREHKPLSRQSCDPAVRQSALGITCLRNGDYHGAIIEADLALRIACALPLPLLLWLVAYCTFSTPPAARTSPEKYARLMASLALRIRLFVASPSHGILTNSGHRFDQKDVLEESALTTDLTLVPDNICEKDTPQGLKLFTNDLR